jgi:hypothetical protein
MPKKSKVGEPSAFYKYGGKFYDDPWVTAIAWVDEDDNSDFLIDMLRSDEPLDAVSREHLAKLFERKNTKNKTNHPPKPSYARKLSYADEIWQMAITDVQALIDSGEDEDEALKKVSKKYRIKSDDLVEAREGRIGSIQRAKKKR